MLFSFPLDNAAAVCYADDVEKTYFLPKGKVPTMKKSFRFFALVLAALMLTALVSCDTAAAAKKYSRGTVDGNVFTSTFSGLTFTKPDDWVYYTDEEIADATGTALEMFKDNEAFEKAADASLIDFYAVAESGDNVNLSYSKGVLFTLFQPSIDKTVADTRAAYESAGITCVVGGQTDAKLGSVEMQKVTFTLTYYGVEMHQYCYFTMVGNYFMSVACTTVTGLTAADFEAMFS